MTQKIFKKSNVEDMKLLFSILPDWVNYICKSGNYNNYFCLEEKPFIFLGNNKEFLFWEKIDINCREELFYAILNIDFETDKPEEMIIKRSDYE